MTPARLFTFQAPTNLTFGSGALKALPEVAAPFGRRPLLISDPGIAGAGILGKVAVAGVAVILLMFLRASWMRCSPVV